MDLSKPFSLVWKTNKYKGLITYQQVWHVENEIYHLLLCQTVRRILVVLLVNMTKHKLFLFCSKCWCGYRTWRSVWPEWVLSQLTLTLSNSKWMSWRASRRRYIPSLSTSSLWTSRLLTWPEIVPQSRALPSKNLWLMSTRDGKLCWKAWLRGRWGTKLQQNHIYVSFKLKIGCYIMLSWFENKCLIWECCFVFQCSRQFYI